MRDLPPPRETRSAAALIGREGHRPYYVGAGDSELWGNSYADQQAKWGISVVHRHQLQRATGSSNITSTRRSTRRFIADTLATSGICILVHHAYLQLAQVRIYALKHKPGRCKSSR
ncbi:hypothetical protein HDV63DRAFT_383449 [Trichoderma sp. SZMC 28014]